MMIQSLKHIFLIVVLYSFLFVGANSQDFSVRDTFQDLTHYSKVFGHQKYYRLYLPKDYSNSKQRFPIVYFFHGWGGRHFKDDNALLAYKKIKNLVDQYKIILVMCDGNMDGKEPRPYNVGNHEDVKYQVQMKDYFPEIVSHIDSNYRTYTDRNYRGIIGFSMGGFMSLFLGGKYPHMVSSVVSFAGSPEFFVGYPTNHTLYPVRYTFRNLEGVDVRIHNGDSDILYFLNNEVYQGALWDGFPLDYWKFHGGHMVDKTGETKVFEMAVKFVANSFAKPQKPPTGWTHYDLYNNFTVWGYNVESNKDQPGFIALRNVDKSGMGIYTHRWLPISPSIDNVHIQVTTPPVYQPNHKYNVVMYNKKSAVVKDTLVTSDQSGRMTFKTDGSGTELGINNSNDAPYLTFLDYNISGRYLRVNGNNPLQIRLFNRGGKLNELNDLRIVLKTNDPDVKMSDSIVHVRMDENRIVTLPAIDITCSKKPPIHATPSEVKFYLRINSGKTTWTDDFVVPVMFDAPFFSDTLIDDGKIVRDTAFGKGNADGVVNAGERVMVYEGNHRLRLYTDDKYVIFEDERLADEVIPAIWPDGYTLSSIIHISLGCPSGHEIKCLASYETKTYNPIERKVIWGEVRLKVK